MAHSDTAPPVFFAKYAIRVVALILRELASMRLDCLFLACGLSALAMTTSAGEARAAGGLFTTMADAATTHVTEHRVVLSLSDQQTSLWDDLSFTGQPSDFAWVMPVKGSAVVAESAYYLFSALNQSSVVEAWSPYVPCPCPDPGCDVPVGIQQGEIESVDIVDHEVVGPYESVRLKSSDPQALQTWLSGHGYALPADMAPVIDDYVAQGYDFLALRLAPGAKVADMRPIRVTTPGKHPTLPLRMMGAGTGAVAPITLWVLADVRYQPTNMPSFTVDPAKLTWNWDTMSSNYAQLRTAGFAATNQDGWLVESASVRDVSWFEVVAIQSGFYPEGPAAAQDDHDALVGAFEQFPYSFTLTRLHAELPHAALTQDLQLGPATTPEQLPLLAAATATGAEPECPANPSSGVASGSSSTGNGTSATGGGTTGAGGGGGVEETPGGAGCSMAVPGSDAGAGVAAITLLLAALARARRQRSARA